MKRTIVAAAMLMSPVLAHAQKDRQQAPQIILPNQEPRGERSYSKDDYILRTPLRWAVAARVQGEVVVTIAQQPLRIEDDALLPLVAVQAQPGTGPFLDVFCTPRKGPKKTMGGMGLLGMVGNALHRSWTDAQTCLIDKDGDGRFDHAMLIGDGGAVERVAHPIQSVGFAVEQNVPVGPGNEVRIRLSGVSAKRAIFELQIEQRGKTLTFESIESDGAPSVDRWSRVQLGSVNPVRAQIFGADFEVIASDVPRKSVTIRWPDTAPRDARREMPEMIVYQAY